MLVPPCVTSYNLGMAVRISSPLLDAIRAQASAAAPFECCGLLLGSARILPASESCIEISAILPAANVAPEPLHRFEVDPAILIAAHRNARDGGPALVGHYHSHPAGAPVPSPVDAEMAGVEGEIWLLAGSGGAVRAWRASCGGSLHGRFEPVELFASPQAPLAPAAAERHDGPPNP